MSIVAAPVAEGESDESVKVTEDVDVTGRGEARGMKSDEEVGMGEMGPSRKGKQVIQFGVENYKTVHIISNNR